MCIKWHQSLFAQSFQPLSTQESSEMCVSSKMCVAVMHVLCSPLYGLESFVGALQHDSELLRSQRIICLKASFYYYSVCLVSS